jgi:hypothetical protein
MIIISNIVTALIIAIIMLFINTWFNNHKNNKIKLEDIDKRLFALENQKLGRDSFADTLQDLKADMIIVKKILDRRKTDTLVENERRQN